VNHSSIPGPVAISVVVCSYNGARKIAGALHALTAQQCSVPFEIVVVDDGSTDTTASVAAGFDVVLIRQQPNGGLSAARNAGIAAARGPIVAFTDDDCVPGTTWIADLLTAWESVDAGVVGIGGHTTPLDVDSICRRYTGVLNPLAPLELDLVGTRGLLGRLRTYLRGPQAHHGGRFVYSLVGANMSFRADALDQVGGFDPVIRFGGDEEDLCTRLRASFGDSALWAHSGIVIAHDFERSIRDTLRRARAYGRGNGREFARHGGFPALRPLPLAAVGVAAVSSPFVWWGGLLAWAVLPWAVYRRAGIDGVRIRGAEGALYPYIAAAQEVANDIGFVEGWWRWRRDRAA
jgi:glycosyltransferase involved in cell wall biosynthesis